MFDWIKGLLFDCYHQSGVRMLYWNRQRQEKPHHDCLVNGKWEEFLKYSSVRLWWLTQCHWSAIVIMVWGDPMGVSRDADLEKSCPYVRECGTENGQERFRLACVSLTRQSFEGSQWHSSFGDQIDGRDPVSDSAVNLAVTSRQCAHSFIHSKHTWLKLNIFPEALSLLPWSITPMTFNPHWRISVGVVFPTH